MLRSLDEVSTGETVDAVVMVLASHADYVVAREQWFGTVCRVHEALAPGIWTLYGYKAVATGEVVLEPSGTSCKFQRPLDPKTGQVALKEVCAGIGGFSLGAVESGFHTLVFLDRSDIACRTIEANGGHTIQADIATREARVALHAVHPDVACMLTAGFPCQPYSRQGDGRGFSDERAHTLPRILEAVWYLQPVGLVLECVVEAERNPEVRALIAAVAQKLRWQQHHVALELADRWPSRRHRWWCILLPADTPFQFAAWPRSEVKPRIREVLGEWPVWSQQELEQLQWDEEEASHFADPSYGQEPRVLDLEGVAPTALHSWGSQLRPCPCRCRGPLSKSRLLAAGLRGFGVPLGDLDTLRHPHPQEVGLLNGLSVKYVHLADLRASLCLVGQLASPLQACWIFAQVRNFRELRHGLASASQPLQVLNAFQQRLVQERVDQWHLPSMDQPRLIQVQQGAQAQKVRVTGAVQAQELIQAEKQLQGPGSTHQLFEGDRRLCDKALLHDATVAEYQLRSDAKKQRKVEVPCRVLVCVQEGAIEAKFAQGALPCQVLQQVGLPAGTQLRFAGTQEEAPPERRLFGSHILDARPLQHMLCEPNEVTDVGVARFLQALVGVLPEGHAVLTPRTASLLQCLQESGQLRGMSGVTLPEANHVYVIAEDCQHWFLLSVDLTAGQATYWDPFPERARVAAERLCAMLGELLGRTDLTFAHQSMTCLGQHCCGALALCHLMLSVGLLAQGSIGLVNWVQDRARALSSGQALHKGAGGLGADTKQALSELLTSKGVPEDKVGARVAEALQKVGASKLEEGLKAQRPWAFLKAVASGVSPPFRWIKADELEQQIRMKADNKFGTAAAEARMRKQAQVKGQKQKEAPPLDPRQLALVEGAFVTEDGTAVPGLSLEDVVSCPTAEPILVAGSLIQMGDAKVLPAQGGAVTDKVNTGVVKVTVYQDQWPGDWESFTLAPVKSLMQQIPLLTLCRGQGCGANCAKFHASIDEAPDTVIHEVWARKFQMDNGSKATSTEATAFQVFLRIPASAVNALQQVTTPGVYVEPRESGQATGPSKAYAVIWLLGMDFQAALHCKRKTDTALALARIGRKYGIRVLAKDEESAFKVLRPEHAFSRIRVTQKFRLHPLPHGITRQGLQQQLDAWQWAAKPLMPTRGDAVGASWEVGAECAPPSAALPTSMDFVLPVQVSNHATPPAQISVLASSRTRKHIYAGPSGSRASTEDPWANGQDPWTKFRNGQGEAPKATTGATEKIREVHQQLRQEVDEAVQTSLAERKKLDCATEGRFQQLETSLTELRAQGQKFESWFTEAGKRMDQTSLEVGALKTAVQGQQQELGHLQGQMAAQGEMIQNTVSQAVVTMRSDLNSQLSTQLNAQMEQFQALLSKKQREGRSRS